MRRGVRGRIGRHGRTEDENIFRVDACHGLGHPARHPAIAEIAFGKRIPAREGIQASGEGYAPAERRHKQAGAVLAQAFDILRIVGIVGKAAEMKREKLRAKWRNT